MIAKVQSAVMWVGSKIKAAFTYVVEHKAEIKEAAEKVIAKVREMALSIHRGLMAAFYRSQLTAYYMDDACLCGGANLATAFRHALNVVKGMSNAEVAYVIYVVRQNLQVESAPQAELALAV
ncbi:MAG: hypothetical protein WC600_01095 [Desulfobaccales bacterium]